MKKSIALCVLLTHLLILVCSGGKVTVMARTSSSAARGPLRVHPKNPRYFADGSGRAIYLVGSHTWANFMDIGLEGSPPFDYEAYMAFMREHRFNFMRFWTWEHGAWATWTPKKVIFSPLPYERTGPGVALDGKPKFDLTKFDQSYFDRMRARIVTAGDNGIYASVMLFQAFSGIWPFSKDHQNDAFRGHYYNVNNNVQGFDGDKDKNSILDIDDPAVRKLQAAYVRKIINTVNDLDNVLYEVINEGGNEDWNRFVVDLVQRYEKTKPRQHPVGVTGHGGVKLPGMLASGAEWISPGLMDAPNFRNVKTDPPAWDGRKVSVLDTDHIWGHGIDYRWVWKSFLRGHNVLFMDPWAPLAEWHNPKLNAPDYLDYPPARQAMRNTAQYAARINLAEMLPHGELASSGFCLAAPGKEYLVYLPEGAEVTLDLSAARDALAVEWMRPVEGTIAPANEISGGSPKQTLKAPFEGDAVLYLRATKRQAAHR